MGQARNKRGQFTKDLEKFNINYFYNNKDFVIKINELIEDLYKHHLEIKGLDERLSDLEEKVEDLQNAQSIFNCRVAKDLWASTADVKEEELKSKCCDASVFVSKGEEGTNHYVCMMCDEACDVSANPIDKEDWKKEFRDKFYTQLIDDYGDEHLFDAIQAFISRLLEAQRKEIQEEMGRDNIKNEKEAYWRGYQDGEGFAQDNYKEKIQEEVNGLRTYTFEPVGGMSNIKYLEKSDVISLLKEKKV